MSGIRFLKVRQALAERSDGGTVNDGSARVDYATRQFT